MKKIIATAILMSSVSSFADADLQFGDVNYFLKQGEVNARFETNLFSVQEKRDFRPASATLETEGYANNLFLGYAFSDRLNAYVGVGYNYDVEVAQSGNADYRQEGWQNPSVGLNYRLLRQNDSSVNLDFGLVGRFNVEDQEIGSATGKSTEDGTAAIGNHALELNSRLGRKWNEANEWQVAAGLIYNTAGEYTLLNSAAGGTDRDFDTDASMDVFLRAAYQYRPIHEFMLSFTTQATRYGQLDSEDGNVSRDRDSHIDLDFIFAAKYLITDGFIVKFNWGMANNPDFNVDSNTAGIAYKTKNRRENFWGLGVDFLF